MPQIYVIKTWTANPAAFDGEGTHVRIEGRAPGIIGWLLSVLGIAPTVALVVTNDKVIYERGSLAGNLRYNTPLEHVCSTLYGFSKPWAAAIVIGFITTALASGCLTVVAGALGPVVGVILGVALGIVYFVLNKSLIIGYTEISGAGHVIAFKRSLIEGQNIDETAAKTVSEIIQGLIDTRRHASK